LRDKKTLEKLRGVHIAFNTPFDVEGEVSQEAVKKLIDCYRNTGIDGVYVCGSTGEGFVLNIDERKRVLEAAMEAANGDLTVIAHIGAAATRDSIELARHAASIKADAISSVPCVYYKLKEAEIKANWSNIIASTDLPFIIYNIPGTTGYDLSTELFGEMASIEKVYGIKNSTFNAYQILQFRKAAGEDFVIYNGPDEQYLAGRLMGADGGIGGSYGVMPELYAAMERAIQKTDIKTAQQLQRAVDHIISQMYSLSSFCGAAKEIIKTRFTDIGAPRLPQAPLTDQGRQRARLIADEIVALVRRFDGSNR